MDMLQVSLEIRSPEWDSKKDWEKSIKEILTLSLKEVAPHLSTSEISIVLTNDKEIYEFNKAYRNKDKATNILSFPQQEPFFFKKEQKNKKKQLPPLLLGDLMISYETVNQEAIDQKKIFTDHLTHLLIHGMLHLLGYDHETEAEAQIMESLELKLLRKFSISDPYQEEASYD